MSSDVDDYIEVHRGLWLPFNGWKEHIILSSGERIIVYRTDQPGKRFNSAWYKDVHFVSQNLEKWSPNTTLCERGWKMTWAYRQGSYVGVVTEDPTGAIRVERLPSHQLLKEVPGADNRASGQSA